jgi:hypothetical protein
MDYSSSESLIGILRNIVNKISRHRAEAIAKARIRFDPTGVQSGMAPQIESYAHSMPEEADLITVYRSADSNADEDSATILELLLKGGFNARVFGDDAPGVVSGTYEVRVPHAEAEAAEDLIGERATEDDPKPVDAEPADLSHDLDLVTVATTDGTTGELEAMAIKSVLDASGIESVIVGTQTLPTTGFEVRVAEEEQGRAEEVIAQARAAGPEAALEAEQAGEQQS